jgi:hypothetical protein
MYDPVRRESGIMDTLKRFAESELDFVVVGGYAVSAYRHRFSIDADIVIRKEDRERFEDILKGSGYRKTISMQLKNIYSSEFVRYEYRELKVSIDLLIGDLGARQTGASFSFEFLFKNSSKRLIEGIEKAIEARVPRREILIILKLHSSRLTDLRDIAALSFNLDMDMIRESLFRGNLNVLRENMKKLESLIEKPEFQDSFKGVFMEKGYNIDPKEIRKLTKLKDNS